MIDIKTHGIFSWNELMTTDVAAAKTFYEKLIGWQMEDMQGEMPYTIAKQDGEEKAGIMPMPPGENMPPAWGGYITVDDVDARAKLCTELGGTVLLPAQDIPNIGRFCVIADPQGAVVSLITYV